jgi:hypothetical protein
MSAAFYLGARRVTASLKGDENGLEADSSDNCTL